MSEKALIPRLIESLAMLSEGVIFPFVIPGGFFTTTKPGKLWYRKLTNTLCLPIDAPTCTTYHAWHPITILFSRTR